MGTKPSKTLVVAAANASILTKAFFDYRCNGVADEAMIQRAVNDLAATLLGFDLKEEWNTCLNSMGLPSE